jgi:thiamine transport system ATP-binding protein
LTGLDPAMHGDMVDLIDKLRREKALTVLMTTHTPDDVQARADQVIRIAEGQVVKS